jgi:murein DD-endopeptidase MepM/ murein hydrolase activator NlpD
LTGGIGWKSGSFGEPRASGPHKGIDIAAIVGTTVYAARSGWVVEATPVHEIVGPGEMATYGPAGNGNFVRIQDVHGGFHTYIHLQSVNVIVGEWVNSDQNIGRVNNTGSSTGNHLHYEYTDSSGTHQDPELEYAC